MGTLYVVATPIGNLNDITLRALEVLSKVGLIAAEDTRQTRKLLSSHGVRAKLVSFNEHNQARRLPALVRALEEGDIALVSDAGTPGISDPGRTLVERAHLEGHRVVPIPGPSAAVAALSASGLDASSYVFLGFLPRRRSDRRELIRRAAGLGLTLLLFEAPHRLKETLDDLLEVLGDRRCLMARELTKVHEEVRLTDLAALRREFEAREALGEITLVIEGAPPARAAEPELSALEEKLRLLATAGLSPRDAVRLVAELTGARRRDVVRVWHAMQRRDLRGP